MRIALVTVCKGRVQHIKETLHKNMFDNACAANTVFVLLDYSSNDGLHEYIGSEFADMISIGGLVYYECPNQPVFHMAHSKNMAHRCAILENCDVVVTLDADNFTGDGFANFVRDNMGKPETFLCPDFPLIKSLPHGPLRPQRGYAGRLAIRAQEFIKLGGYHEVFNTWGGEDIDLIARLQRSEYKMGLIPNHFLNAIPHTAEVRFKEYPHAKVYEAEGEWKKFFNRTETVVNYGNIGCGTVYRNFSETPIELKPLPTRIFGIGMHKTATTSLAAAFQILGYDTWHWNSNREAWRIWNEMNGLGRSTLLERSYALCDNPIPMLYKKLDTAYPGSKFVLTVRDEEDWLRSVAALWDRKRNPHYDWDRQPFSHQIHQALYGTIHFNPIVFRDRYRQHNAEVLEYFKDRPDDLLVMDMSKGAGWGELCPFLGVPVPTTEYPMKFVTK